jgi:hypothetical protein
VSHLLLNIIFFCNIYKHFCAHLQKKFKCRVAHVFNHRLKWLDECPKEDRDSRINLSRAGVSFEVKFEKIKIINLFISHPHALPACYWVPRRTQNDGMQCLVITKKKKNSAKFKFSIDFWWVFYFSWEIFKFFLMFRKLFFIIEFLYFYLDFISKRRDMRLPATTSFITFVHPDIL